MRQFANLLTVGIVGAAGIGWDGQQHARAWPMLHNQFNESVAGDIKLPAADIASISVETSCSGRSSQKQFCTCNVTLIRPYWVQVFVYSVRSKGKAKSALMMYGIIKCREVVNTTQNVDEYKAVSDQNVFSNHIRVRKAINHAGSLSFTWKDSSPENSRVSSLLPCGRTDTFKLAIFSKKLRGQSGATNYLNIGSGRSSRIAHGKDEMKVSSIDIKVQTALAYADYNGNPGPATCNQAFPANDIRSAGGVSRSRGGLKLPLHDLGLLAIGSQLLDAEEHQRHRQADVDQISNLEAWKDFARPLAPRWVLMPLSLGLLLGGFVLLDWSGRLRDGPKQRRAEVVGACLALLGPLSIGVGWGLMNLWDAGWP